MKVLHMNNVRAAVLMLVGALAFCLIDKSSGQDAAAIAPLMDDWLRGPTETTFPGKSRSRTQTYLSTAAVVEVQAAMRAKDLGERDHEWTLLFTVAVRDGRGRWIRDPRPTTVEMPPKLGSQENVFYSRGIYLCPGSYVIAVVAYDTDFRRVNVRFPLVYVLAVKNDPLSNLENASSRG